MTYPPEYAPQADQPPPRVTAYGYVYSRGLMAEYGTMEWLFEIGRRAAGEARWRGIEEQKIWEGGGFEWFWVNQWPPEIFAGVIAQLEREAKTAFADAATAQAGTVPDYPGPYDPNEDVTAYPGPNGTQAGYDLGY